MIFSHILHAVGVYICPPKKFNLELNAEKINTQNEKYTPKFFVKLFIKCIKIFLAFCLRHGIVCQKHYHIIGLQTDYVSEEDNLHLIFKPKKVFFHSRFNVIVMQLYYYHTSDTPISSLYVFVSESEL